MCRDFIIAVFVTAKTVNDLVFVVCDCLNQLWYSLTLEYYTATKKNKNRF